MILDSQLHVWSADNEQFPWDAEYSSVLPSHLLGRFRNRPVSVESALNRMNDANVDGAILTSAGIYGADHRFAFEAAETYRGRFVVVGPVSPESPGAEDAVSRLAEHPLGVGARLIVFPKQPDVASQKYRQLIANIAGAGLPLFLTAMGMLDSVPKLIRAHPDLTVVLDHLGLMDLAPAPARLAQLPSLLRLGKYENVIVKCTGMPELSTEPYPFLDLWPHLGSIIEAFGVERVIWGSDYTQHEEELTYRESVDYIRASDRLGETEKRAILGGNLESLIEWPPTAEPGESSSLTHVER